MQAQRGGTRYTERDGRLIRVTDRTGAVHAELVWSAAQADRPERAFPLGLVIRLIRLVRLDVAGASVDGAVVDHPLLGPAHAVGDTAMSALDWSRPCEIPAIAEPGRLPLGAGGAILNTIALLAERAGVAQLRYAGPYPTAALWRALGRSFRTGGDEATFTADALGRALRVAREPIAVDFAPAPHERIAIAGGFVELRGVVERAVIDGVSYEPGATPSRLVAADPAGAAAEPADAADPLDRIGANVAAEVWFGDAPYARVAVLSADGTLLDGPHPVAPCRSGVVGRAFPPPLVAALAELVAEAVVPPLAAAARELCAGHTLRWADLGARAAAETADGFAVHAALWDRIAPLGLARLALALTEALAPVVTAAAVRRASRAAALPHASVASPSNRGM